MSERFPYIAVYIMADRPLGVIYIGVASDLPRRAYEHREGLFPGFTLQYGCKTLVWYEPHQMMAEAIRREKALKRWNRVWKLELIEQMNPEWRDLYETLNQ